MIFKYTYGRDDSLLKIVIMAALVLVLNLALMAAGVIACAALVHVGWDIP